MGVYVEIYLTVRVRFLYSPSTFSSLLTVLCHLPNPVSRVVNGSRFRGIKGERKDTLLSESVGNTVNNS